MLPDSILPAPEDDIARMLANLEKRVSSLERLDEALGWTLISDVEIAVPVASIDFTNIPADFKHLKILGWLRSANAAASDGLRIRFNGIATANYYSVTADIRHVNTLATTQVLAATLGFVAFIAAATADAALFSTIEMLFPDYLDGANKKQWLSLNSFIFATTSGSIRWGGSSGFLSTLTTAINRITFTTTFAANFVAGSRLSLYGIK